MAPEQVLSQNEVNALLNAVDDGSLAVEQGTKADEQAWEYYDLASQDKIIRGRMAGLEVINDRLNRYLQISLGSLMRRVVDVHMEFSGLMKFGEFINQLIAPMALNLFKMPPLRGVCLAAIESRFVFSMLNSFFGGLPEDDKDIENIDQRDFTLIEMNIVRKVIQTILTEYEKAWHPVYEVRCQYLRTELNPQFIGGIPNADVVINTQYTIEFDNAVGALNIVIPYSLIEPIKQKLTVTSQSEEQDLDINWINRLKEEMLKAEVNMKVDLGNASLTVNELKKLKKGDIIMLDTDSTQPLTLKIENVDKMRGLPIVHKGHMALKITEAEIVNKNQASL